MTLLSLGDTFEFQRLYRLFFVRFGRRHLQIEWDSNLWDRRYWTWDLSRDEWLNGARRIFIGPFEISWHLEP